MKKRLGNIIFIGFTSCGKSVIGKLIAEQLSYRFVDLDTGLEKLYREQGNPRRYCRDIYAEHGQEYFNLLEFQTLTTLKNQSRLVVSPGGGVLQEEQSRSLLRQIGTVIYLSTSPDVIFERMKNRGFPLYLADNPSLENITLHWEKRKNAYETNSDFRIDNSYLTPKETAEAVMELCTTHFIMGDT